LKAIEGRGLVGHMVTWRTRRLKKKKAWEKITCEEEEVFQNFSFSRENDTPSTASTVKTGYSPTSERVRTLLQTSSNFLARVGRA
jgi:hypothetical protein